MTEPMVGGRNWRRCVNDAQRATKEVRIALEAVLREQPSARVAGLVGTAAISLLRVREALNELEKFGDGEHGEARGEK